MDMNIKHTPSALMISVGLHMTVILWAIIFVAPTKNISMPHKLLPLEIVSIAEFTKLLHQKESHNSKRKSMLSPPMTQSPKNALIPLSPPLITEPQKTKSLIQQSVIIPQKRPILQKVNKILNTNALHALLDKTPDLSDKRVSFQNRNDEDHEKMTLSEIDVLRVQIQKCWTIPAGIRNAEKRIIRVQLGLSREGNIILGPIVVNRAGLGNRYFRIAAESVLRAIRRCQPFEMPLDKYHEWRELELNFDPQNMLMG